MSGLVLVPLLLASREQWLRPLADALQERFERPVRIRPPWFDPERAYDTSRQQHNSTVILEQLLDDPTGEDSLRLGVAGVDLFIPVLTHVFGEAQLDGEVAVVSLHRLRPQVYGLPAADDLVHRRLEKEAVHELGHTLGLIHCAHPHCVMHASTYVEEIDIKSADYCLACLRAIRSKTHVGSRRARGR